MQRYLTVIARHDPGPTEDDRRILDSLSEELRRIPSDEHQLFIVQETWAANVEEFVGEKVDHATRDETRVTIVFTSSRDVDLARSLRRKYSHWQVFLLAASMPHGEITIFPKFTWASLNAGSLKTLITHF